MKKHVQVIALVALLISLPACLLTPPERHDPFAGLSAPNSSIAANKDLVIGLVLSDNTKNAMRYAEDFGQRGGMFGDPRAARAASQLFEEIAAVFQKNFKATIKMEKVEKAAARNVDVVAILDIFLELPNTFAGDVKVDTSAAFLTVDGKTIDTIKASDVQGASKYLMGVSAAMEEAVKVVKGKFENSLTASVKLTEFAKSKTGESTAVAAMSQVPSVARISSDVDRVPAVKTTAKKHAYAIVIGIEQYREQLPKANFAAHDASVVGDYVTKVLGYPEENVVVRLNDKATKTDLEKYFEGWLPNNVEKDSSVFVYFSGHGAPHVKTGDAYLVPYDGDPTFVDKTGYSLKRLYAALDKLPAKDVTVVLDSCFSGAGGRSVLAEGARPMGLALETQAITAGRITVLSASSGDQSSNTFKEQGHGLLTYFFLKGLQGEGDVNKDGSIEMVELLDYVKPNVQRVARKQYNNEQTPQLLASPETLKKGGGRLLERPRP
jgi:hypothetical protein